MPGEEITRSEMQEYVRICNEFKTDVKKDLEVLRNDIARDRDERKEQAEKLRHLDKRLADFETLKAKFEKAHSDMTSLSNDVKNLIPQIQAVLPLAQAHTKFNGAWEKIKTASPFLIMAFLLKQAGAPQLIIDLFNLIGKALGL